MEELTGLTPESILNEDIMMGGIFIEFVELFTHNLIDVIIKAILIWCRFEIISGQKLYLQPLVGKARTDTLTVAFGKRREHL